MGTKQNLLALLEGRRGSLVSGQQAAQVLGISRAAVCKAIKSLREQGLSVQSVPGGGYRLPKESDWLSEAAVRHCLAGPYPVQVFDEVDSTNLCGKRWAIDGAPHGALLVAGRQTAGRGRLGRSFVSPPGGLYLSIVLRPEQQKSADAVFITAAAAVAVCGAVAQLCGRELSIKWVNDLFYQHKKCCGILTEAATGMESGGIEYMVVGIGLNYTTPQHCLQPLAAATSLFPAGGAPVPRAQLAADIHRRLLAAFDTLSARTFLPEYRRRSLVLGRPVTVMARVPYEATAVAIDDEARLVVQTPDGKTEAIAYGEISVRL